MTFQINATKLSVYDLEFASKSFLRTCRGYLFPSQRSVTKEVQLSRT